MKPLLFVTVDALSPQLLKETNTPFINKHITLVENAVSCFPTLTTPMMSTILTGCFPSKHGIYGNAIFDRSDSTVKGKLRQLRVKTLGEMLEENGYRILSVQHFMMENKVTEYIQTDGGNNDCITRAVLSHLDGYNAFFIIYQSIDALGHRYGPSHKVLTTALEGIDRGIEAIYNRISAQSGEPLLVLCSDHSMSLAHSHSNFSIEKIMKEFGLSFSFLSEGDTYTGQDCIALHFPTIPLFLLSEKAKNAEISLLERIIEHKDVERIYTKSDMIRLGNDGYGDIAYCLKKGLSTLPPLVLNIRKYGYHGTPSEEPAVIGFSDERNRKSGRLVDITPTVLDLLSLRTTSIFDGVIL
jgi:predicted AlkP superfamily pyrophosphatase or phosphodiesterase